MSPKALSMFLIAAIIASCLIYIPPVKAQVSKIKWLKADGTYIKDENGNIFLLHGCCVMDFRRDLTEEDIKRMLSWGFNVIRISIGWDIIEPSPAKYNYAYLREIDEFVKMCKRLGMYVILDMHQWRWCRKYGGHGIPEWLCEEYDTEDEAKIAFWRNPSYWTYLAEVWRMLAERYRNEPTVAAYDLFNEPNAPMDVIEPEELSEIIAQFYNTLIKAVRSVDKRHICIFEPIWGAPIFSNYVIKPSGENIVYSTHVYSGGTWDPRVGYNGDIQLIQADVELSYRTALKFNVPLFIGEFGVGSAAPNCSKWCRDVLYFLDKYSIGRTWWCYYRDDSSYGLLYSDGREKSHILKYLDRCYIRSSTHPFTSYFNPDNSTFKTIINVTDTKDLTLELYISKRHFKEPVITVNNTIFELEKSENSSIAKIHINHGQLDGSTVTVSVYEKSVLEEYKLNVKFISPANNSFLNNGNLTFHWKTVRNPRKCIVKLDGATIYTGDYIDHINLNLSEGEHSLTVYVFDEFNQMVCSSITLTIDCSPPCILSIEVAETIEGTLVKVKAVDNVSYVEKVLLAVDGEYMPMQKLSADMFHVYVPEYIHAVEAYVIAIDAAGNMASIKVNLPRKKGLNMFFPLMAIMACTLLLLLLIAKAKIRRKS